MSSAVQTPAGWFDQFPPAPAGWAHPQWCWRHWAPCPLLGANGIGATLETFQAWADTLGDVGSQEALEVEFDTAGALCCVLGDDRMYQIWGRWPPAGSRPAGGVNGRG